MNILFLHSHSQFFFSNFITPNYLISCYSKLSTALFMGLKQSPITVEVNVSSGKYTTIVGLAVNAVKESLERMESAIKANGYHFPRTKVVLNLASADIRKSGTAFDLPIAMFTLGASEQLGNAERLTDYVIMGELSLDGAVRPIKGALPIAIQARKEILKD